MSKYCQNRKVLGRMGRHMDRIRALSSKLAITIERFDDNWDELENCLGAMFSLVNNKPVVHVMGPDGELTTQKFFALLDDIGDGAEDFREMEIWRDAFEKGAKRLDAKIRRCRKDPQEY